MAIEVSLNLLNTIRVVTSVIQFYAETRSDFVLWSTKRDGRATCIAGSLNFSLLGHGCAAFSRVCFFLRLRPFPSPKALGVGLCGRGARIEPTASTFPLLECECAASFLRRL
ncbi:hypothetical protein PAXRUDRAFT_508415 [Paxillus rubicundulus Ve08.2h10]|uniref:Uncharacterized protein n=1 Tax=Paxillus rubicundulus Ve08.2h10 TaxID=930991 RepID=A0A0D0D975_9AGAM|nr:hypothetical protein PAXRUDRAFT_508415 [Paxillus rubicundulus Ve08.2h10]